MKKNSKLKTIILDVVDPQATDERAEVRLEEIQNLVKTAGGIVIEKIIQRRGRPSMKTFLGTGKIEEAAEYARENKIELVIINGILKPNQYLHLQDVFPKKMLWDRTDLILNIFDKHATSTIAQMQIKAARLKHEIPKIYARHATTLFERAGAGIGTRGAGEKGIEDEKRHIRKQIKQIEDKIAAARKVQVHQRKARSRTGMKTVALVGYTNAGKSSLMQVLTHKKGVVANDELFTTLDTKIGKTWLPHIREEVLVADTIGFISDLPPRLIESFMTTLEEAQNADTLLHVIDVSDPKYREKIQTVDDILRQLGCQSIRQIYVCNKVDKAPDFDFQTFFQEFPHYSPVRISCTKEEGIEELKKKMV